MLIAKIENGTPSVADYRALFPRTSFPASGPDVDFLRQNGCLPVDAFIPHDRATQRLVPATPYVSGARVLTVRVEAKTAAEIAAESSAAEASRIAEIDRQRAEAYRAESDPLFFKAQRGEATQQQWLDAVAAIKARLPKTPPLPTAGTGTGA